MPIDPEKIANAVNSSTTPTLVALGIAGGWVANYGDAPRTLGMAVAVGASGALSVRAIAALWAFFSRRKAESAADTARQASLPISGWKSLSADEQALFARIYDLHRVDRRSISAPAGQRAQANLHDRRLISYEFDGPGMSLSEGGRLLARDAEVVRAIEDLLGKLELLKRE